MFLKMFGNDGLVFQAGVDCQSFGFLYCIKEFNWMFNWIKLNWIHIFDNWPSWPRPWFVSVLIFFLSLLLFPFSIVNCVFHSHLKKERRKRKKKIVSGTSVRLRVHLSLTHTLALQLTYSHYLCPHALIHFFPFFFFFSFLVLSSLFALFPLLFF